MTDPPPSPLQNRLAAPMPAKPCASSCRNTCAADSILPVLRLLLDLAFLGVCIAGACYFSSWWAKALMVVPASVAIARLFVIGHDACHGSYTRYDWLNKIVGRIAFLPSLTPFSLWDVGHNVAHHGFTNLKGRDQVWVPMSAEEWQAASKVRRVLERIYRSGFGQGLYYLIEMWWKKLILPTQETRRRAPRDFLVGQRAGAGRRRGVDHGAGAVGRLRQSLGHLDAAVRLRAAVPGVQLHHGFRDLRAAHASGSGLVRQARGMAEAPRLHHHHRQRGGAEAHGPDPARHPRARRASREHRRAAVPAARRADRAQERRAAARARVRAQLEALLGDGAHLQAVRLREPPVDGLQGPRHRGAAVPGTRRVSRRLL